MFSTYTDPKQDYAFSITILYKLALFYLNILLLVGLELILDLSVQTIYRQYRPTAADLLKQEQKKTAAIQRDTSKGVIPSSDTASDEKLSHDVISYKDETRQIEV